MAGEKISKKSIFSLWLQGRPCVSTNSLSFSFFLKIHLQPIDLQVGEILFETSLKEDVGRRCNVRRMPPCAMCTCIQEENNFLLFSATGLEVIAQFFRPNSLGNQPISTTPLIHNYSFKMKRFKYNHIKLLTSLPDIDIFDKTIYFISLLIFSYLFRFYLCKNLS